MRKRHGWVGKVLVIALAVAMAGALSPGLASAQQQTKNVQSLFDVRISGTVIMAVAWTSDETALTGPAVVSIAPRSKGSPFHDRHGLRWTASSSNLRFAISGPEVLWGAKSSGLIAFDFSGPAISTSTTSGTFGSNLGAGATNPAALQEAYATFAYPMGSVIVGQTFILFGGGARSGAPAFGTLFDFIPSFLRAPQVQLRSAPIPLGIPDTTLTLAGAAQVSTTTRDTGLPAQSISSLYDSGTRSAEPQWALSLSVASTALFKRLTNVVVSGTLGEETLAAATIGPPAATTGYFRDVDKRGVSVRAIVPLGPATPFGSWDIRAGYHWSENLIGGWSLNSGVQGIPGIPPWNTYGTTGGALVPSAAFFALSDPKLIASQSWYTEINGVITRNFSLGGGYAILWDDRSDLQASHAITAYTEGVPADLSRQRWWIYVRWVEGPVDVGLQYTAHVEKWTDFVKPDYKTAMETVNFMFRYNF